MKAFLYPISSYRVTNTALLLALVGLFCGGDVLGRDDSWKKSALLIYSDTSLEMNRLRARGLGDNRLADYVHALGLMFNEPTTSEAQAQARFELDKLIEGGSSDDVGVASQFYRIRIDQSVAGEIPINQSISDRYRQLFESNPDHFFGQMGLLKHLTYELHQEQPQLASDRKFASIEKKAEAIKIPQLQRSYHKSLGEYCIDHGLPKGQAFKHLKASYDIGFSVKSTQSELAFKVGNLAIELGQPQYAIRVFEEFLKTAPKLDGRRAEAESSLKEARRLLLRGS